MQSITSPEYLSELLDAELPALERATVKIFRLALKSPFETSFGSIDYREIVLCELDARGLRGYGESASDTDPLYSYETTVTTRYVLQQYLIEELKSLRTIGDFLKRIAPIRGFPMAKATAEAALWDLLAKSKSLPLYKLWGGTKDRIPSGVSVGLQKDNDTLMQTIRAYLNDGYRRIKIKIKPHRDRELIETIRKEFPELPLMADANAAYRLADTPLLQSLDEFHLMMIEQPLHFEDIYEHSILQRQIATPVCLDESIISERAAKAAIELNACKIINIKTGRVGGHTESMLIHNLARKHAVPVWCGGMLESGIGRAHNLALASLPNFTLPGDTSASKRYWHRDVVSPEVLMDPDGYITLPQKPGIGYDLDQSYLDSLVSDRFSVSL
jgi:O-succinylbenzoate synthase